MLTALADAQGVLCLGIGGGGDCVGAYAVAEIARALGTPAHAGGITWERRPVDPLPGARRLDELVGADPLNAVVALATAATSGPQGARFCESHLSEATGERVVLADPNPGPAALGAGLADAARQLGCDLVALVDVGGDALAHGDEAGLASPLADAVCLAAAEHVDGVATLGVVIGAGCDGELHHSEVLERIAEVAAAGGGRGAVGLEPLLLDRVERAARDVPTEASALALQAARGRTGPVPIRNGRRTVDLSPVAGLAFGFDVAAALGSAARCADAVRGAESLVHANTLLGARGIRTELDYETDLAGTA